jgi:hypothetical protein
MNVWMWVKDPLRENSWIMVCGPLMGQWLDDGQEIEHEQ